MEKNFFEKEVKRIKQLAYLNLTPEEEEKMVEHFKKMYDFVSRLKEVDTDKVDMLIYPHEGVFLKMESDIPKEGLSSLEVMKNAPDTFKEYIRVKSPIKEAKIRER